MSLDIYWGSGSLYSWRVILMLELKSIAYQSHLLQFFRGEHKTPAMLALNPRGKLPVLQDGDTAVCESLAIMAYLERRYPEPPLFGVTPAQTGRIWQGVSEVSSYLDDNVVAMFFRLFVIGADLERVKKRAMRVQNELPHFEQRLSRSDYAAGSTVSAADIMLCTALGALLRTARSDKAQGLDLGFDSFDQTYPALGAYLARMAALPAFERAYPPHWKT